jgi:hypothetical protein
MMLEEDVHAPPRHPTSAPPCSDEFARLLGGALTIAGCSRRAGIADYASVVEQGYQGARGPVRQHGGPPLTTSLKAEKIHCATYSPDDAPGNQLPQEPGPGGRPPSPR